MVRHSWVIVGKRLKYYQISQFCPFGPHQGEMGGGGGEWSWGASKIRKNTGLLTQGIFLLSFKRSRKSLRKNKNYNLNKTIRHALTMDMHSLGLIWEWPLIRVPLKTGFIITDTYFSLLVHSPHVYFGSESNKRRSVGICRCALNTKFIDPTLQRCLSRKQILQYWI